jgi:hypothetical protein
MECHKTNRFQLRAFVSWIAARKVQTAPAVAQDPFPGTASETSPVSLTTNDAAETGLIKK